MSEFWSLTEQARADASGDGTAWPTGATIGAALTARLAHMPLERVVEFDHCRQRAAEPAHQWTVCAAAFVIWNYLSDDAFSDFKAGLIGLGRDTFERVVTDPEVPADHPMVRAIAAGEIDRHWSGTFGSPDDTTQIPLRLPRPHALFSE